ncbi:MAG: hypothetical protein KGQ59_05800 [Bdellovibrionales bacterium]|nr:hypothetical protein [Bdellovibrionales bacterium]
MRERYLGLELSGAKNNKTSLSILEYYPKEQKTFLLDIQDRIAGTTGVSHHEPHHLIGAASADDVLLEILRESDEELAALAVNVPLTLPPFFLSNNAEKIAVEWMNRFSKRAIKAKRSGSIEFTAYTQRPVEIWIRHHVLSQLPKSLQFEVDETLGGNRAPLTARMQYLQRYLDRKTLIEAWPKLTALRLCLQLGMDRRFISRYRKLEEGAHARLLFLEQLVARHGIFIYDRDMRKLSTSLTAFDSFLCAYTALLSHLGKCEKSPRGFPVSSGWVEYPKESW